MTELSEKSQARLKLLQEVVSIPTASFHESAVAAYIVRSLGAMGITPEIDPYGNILARLAPTAGAAPEGALSICFVAHMDHPAFELVSVEAGAKYRATARLLGGVAPRCFRDPVAVRLYHDLQGEAPGGTSTLRSISATIVGYEAPSPRDVTLKLECASLPTTDMFGVFDLPDFLVQTTSEGNILSLRVADDLVGCSAILLALKELKEQGAPVAVSGLFTRAEEVGLVGASLAARDGIVSRETIILSYETSKELPDAIQGDGPVIRVGDRARCFHPEAEAVLLAARDTLGRPVQRQLMSGGVCEATAFGLRGYRTIGVALPLGNYHNVGPDETIRSETIHQDDFLTSVDLLVESAVACSKPRDYLWERYYNLADRFESRLRATRTAGLDG